MPPGQTVGSPAAQERKSQPCSPARPSGHSSTQLEPSAQVAVQSWSKQEKRHWLRGPQSQAPFAHVPSHVSWSPSQRTWHGPEAQSNAQLAPRSQAQVPFAHVPTHMELPAQLTWHGGLWQAKRHSDAPPHAHDPLPHSAAHEVSSPSHSTWHGGAPHGMWQSWPSPQ